jgi:hypothetical protein
MMKMTIVDIAALAGGSIVAGAAEGATTLSKLIAHSATTGDPTWVLLDFRSVDVGTASFLRESVLGFRDYCRKSRPNLYPLLTGVGAKVAEEFEGLLKLKGDAFVLCDLEHDRIVRPRVLGKLDPKQAVALQAVLRAGRADASALAKDDSDTPNPTAWNNRLVSLTAKGLLRETQVGRGKEYQPVVEGLHYGR